MPAQRHDFSMEEGTTVGKTLAHFVDGAALDLSGYEARLVARIKRTDATPVINLTSDPVAGLVVEPGGAKGLITMVMTPTQTAALDFKIAKYDLEIYTTDDATVYRTLTGYITLDREMAQ